jgi:hypothetical protein
MSSTRPLSAVRPPLSARVFSDHDFPPSLACRWKKPWLQPKSADAQTWVMMARPTKLLKYAHAYQRVELSSGYANLPRERPRHAPTSRRRFSFWTWRSYQSQRFTCRTLARLQRAAIAKADHELVGYPDPECRTQIHTSISHLRIRIHESSTRLFTSTCGYCTDHGSDSCTSTCKYSGVLVSIQGKKCILYRVTFVKYSSWILT